MLLLHQPVGRSPPRYVYDKSPAGQNQHVYHGGANPQNGTPNESPVSSSAEWATDCAVPTCIAAESGSTRNDAPDIDLNRDFPDEVRPTLFPRYHLPVCNTVKVLLECSATYLCWRNDGDVSILK